MQNQIMEGYQLIKRYHKLVLQQKVAKVLCFSTAYSDTFVFSKVINPGADEAIVHVDRHGQVLFEKRYNDIINFFGMLNEDQVIVMDVPNAHIDIINLRTKTTRSINHGYLFDDVAQMSIETFFNTKMFCIVEKGTFNDPRLKLSYYREEDYKNKELQTGIIYCHYQSVNNIWTYEYPVKRVNDSSKIGWFKYRHESHIEFYIYSIDNNPQGALQLIKVKNTIGVPYGMQNCRVSLANLWQQSKDTYILVCNSNKEHKQRNHDGIVNNNYVLNVKDGTVRQTAFYFKDKNDGFAWNDQMIEYFYLGDISVFHTFRHEAGKTLTTPIYYVHNETEQVVAQQDWQATCYVNFFVPGFAKNTVIEGFYMNGDVREIGVTTKSLKKKMIDPRIISMFFMLHINEDFDDDLLSDAIELLHGQDKK